MRSSSNDYSDAQLDRYDSLKSLYRLVENDLSHQISTSRRCSLPMKKSSLNLYTSGAKWRNSSVTDYMRALTSTRENIIQRLLPEVVVDDRSVGNQGNYIERRKGSKADISKMNKLCEDLVTNYENNRSKSINGDTSESQTADYKLRDTNAVERVIDDLRERVARFEALKNVSRSVHADDFQQFLGERYLEIYQKRHTGRSKQMPNVRNRRNSCLNVKLHAIARRLSKRKKPESELKVILPQLTQEAECDQALGGLENETQPDSSESKTTNDHNRIVPIQNDLTDEYLKISSMPGIPHHAASRALSRHFQSRRLNSVLTGLRRFTTVQTTELEQVLDRQDGEN